jgi:hypothetical protein
MEAGMILLLCFKESNMKKYILLLALVLFMLSCSTVNRFFSKPQLGDLDAEEQAVYVVLLSDYDRPSIVLSQTTDSGFDFTGQTEKPNGMPNLSRELWEEYLARNDRSYPLSPEMAIGRQYTLLGGEEMSDIFNNYGDGWEEFYRRYPDSPGITTLSRVGFNQDGTEALVYMGAQLHYLAGAGYLIRLEKQNGEWKIVDKMMLWVS